MPGWDSLQTVTAVHGAFQLAGLVLLVVLAALAAFAAYQLRGRQWPEWFDVGDYQLRSRFFEIGCAAVFALLVVSEVVAYRTGFARTPWWPRPSSRAPTGSSGLTAESKTRPVADTPSSIPQGKFRAAAEADRGREQARGARADTDAKASVGMSRSAS